ncbi:hypothetical protein HanHA300_Chr07g0248521 [Helianthus annuus]|nr:hypothetical protein HanHA300_Chr07g0248521 [Helianthus annuus]KAJ0563636.1 hypothetical protein HanHA89_Chr07g0265331 [Helianthus annuus]
MSGTVPVPGTKCSSLLLLSSSQKKKSETSKLLLADFFSFTGVNFEDTEDIAVSCYTKTYRVFQMFVRDSLEWMYLVRRGVINFFVGLLFLRMLILYTVLASD